MTEVITIAGTEPVQSVDDLRREDVADLPVDFTLLNGIF